MVFDAESAFAELAGHVSELASRVVTHEDLLVPALMFDGSLSVQKSVPAFTCPFPLRLTYLALTKFGPGTIARSDTSWWLTRVRRTPVGTISPIALATKTTRLTAGTEPAGEAWMQAGAWIYDGADLVGADCDADDVVSLVLAPQNNPDPIVGPCVATFGYVPL
jgi:hypothetical protein